MIPQIMSRPEAQQQLFWPELAKREDLVREPIGGSFKRVVSLGETSHGMRYSQGDSFPLKFFLDDSKGTGTELAPGRFAAIYIKVRLPGGANDYKIVRINPDSSINTVFGLSIDGNFPQYHDYGPSHVDDYLDEGNQVLNIGEPNKFGDVIEEVVVKKWGRFTPPVNSVALHPKARPNPNMLQEIPISDIEKLFNQFAEEANK